MAAIFLGDMAFQETVGSTLNVDPWGMDTLTRKVNGKSTAGVAYIATLARKRDVRDSEYQTLFMTEYSAAFNGAIWEVTITYKGIINSTVQTEPVFESGTRRQQVSVPFVLDELGQTSGIQAVFTYLAPYSRVMYVLPEEPTSPRYRGRVHVTKDSLSIVDRQGAGGNYAIFAGRFLNTSVPNIVSGNNVLGNLRCYNMVANSFSQMEWKPVGQWWEVTEQNEVLLQSLDLANAGYTVELPQ